MPMCCKMRSYVYYARYFYILIFLAAIIGVTANSWSQTVRFRSANQRLTLPIGFSGTAVFTNNCTVSGLLNPVDLTISGLPAGVTYAITTTNNVALPLDGGFPSTLISTNVLVTLTFDGTQSQGIYNVSLNGSGGAVNNLLFEIQIAKIWSGANYIGNVSTNWNDSGNWGAGSVPTASDDVVFAQSGATNAAAITNILVTSSTEVASIRFAPTNSSAKFYTMQIQPGVTLAATGTNAFSVHKDTLNVYNGAGNGGVTVTIKGIGGTLSVSNKQGTVLSSVDNQQASLLDLSDLGNFNLNVKQVAWGDCDLIPNFRNWNTPNAYGGQPRSFNNDLTLARTNVIVATYADPNNYTNADDRHFSFSWMRAESSGSTSARTFSFGISNMFFVDSINLGGGNARGSGGFNSIFNASNPIAIFRGTNGGRMAVFSIADGAGTNGHASSPNNIFNFLAGTLDIRADRLYIGRDRRLVTSGQNPNYSGTLLAGKGTVDANTVVLGYREYEQTNAYPPYNLNSQGYCVGRITVSNGVFRVNNSLTLGYTVAATQQEENTGGNTDQGQLSVINGGSAFVNTIIVSGPSYGFAKNNNLMVSNNASLTISNFCGGTNQMLDNATFALGSTLIGYLNATSTVAMMYATNFNMNGSNSFVLAGIRNPLSLVNGQEIPLFKRAAGAAPNFTLINQSGINGSVVVDGVDANQLNFKVILTSPKSLLWKGYVSSDWDNATKNWLDLTTGQQTNFVAGDIVSFDDTASQFNISINSSSVILPGAVTMTNNLNIYTFNASGRGSIIGTATISKYGTNTLQFDASGTASVSVNSGLLNGAGTVAGVTIASGASLDYTGTINGNLAVAGVAISSGSVNGILTVNSGGVVTNAGTITGAFTVNTNGFFVNNLGASLANIASSSINAGGSMLNRGNISGANLTVNGQFKDTGEGATSLSTTFTAGAGSLIIPGGDAVATTTIQALGGVGFPGRVLLSQGSTNILKVDILGNNNTKILSGYQDFGGSANARSQNGCTLIITNVTGSFAAGQTFTFFQYAGGGNPLSTGTSTNTYPVISPETPGPGLAWDLTQLWPGGVIGVTTNTGPLFTNTFTIVGGTNVIGQFSWDVANYGWSLQNKTVPLGEGVNSSNAWTRVSGSWTNTAVLLTNNLTTNNVYFRLAFP